MKNICVLGSLNMDFIITTDCLPTKGQTIHGKDCDYLLGGKGANQAVAANRMEIKTTMLGCVGDDTFGEKIKSYLTKESNLNTSYIKTCKNNFTGVASVFKLAYDNAIVVIPGTNTLCDEQYVQEHLHVMQHADVLLSQLEVPIETICYAFPIAKQYGVKTILNPAPYSAIPEDLFEYIDYITPNETEFMEMTHMQDGDAIEEHMRIWQKMHTTILIVTRGSLGCSYVEADRVITIPAYDVLVVDTTGAGDTFNGVLAYGIASDTALQEAISQASIAASLSTRAFGAQTGMPYKHEIDNIKGEYKL